MLREFPSQDSSCGQRAPPRPLWPGFSMPEVLMAALVLFEHPRCLFWMVLLNEVLQETLSGFTFPLSPLGLREGLDPGHTRVQQPLVPMWDWDEDRF